MTVLKPHKINLTKSCNLSLSPQPQPTTNAHGHWSPAHLGGIGRRDEELEGALGSGKGIGKGKERG